MTRPKPYAPETPYMEDYNRMLNSPKKKLLQNHSPEEIRHLEMLMGGPQNLVMHFNLTPTEYQLAIGNIVPRPPPQPHAFLNPIPVIEPINIRKPPMVSRATISRPVRFVGPSPSMRGQPQRTIPQNRPKLATLMPTIDQPAIPSYNRAIAPPSGYTSQYHSTVKPLDINQISPLRNKPNTISQYRPSNPVRINGDPVNNYNSTYQPNPQRTPYPSNHRTSPSHNYPSQSNYFSPQPTRPSNNYRDPMKKSILKNAIPDVLSGAKRPESPNKRVKFSPFRNVADPYGYNHMQREVQPSRRREIGLDTIDGVGNRGGGNYGNQGYYG